MTTVPDNDHKKRSDIATALLTLATEKGVVAGSCLSDEELALLVEGRNGGRELAELWAHLGNCDKCYEVWLSLKKGTKAEAPRGRLYRLSRIKTFGYIGTVLAAAASIVVYLNVIKMDKVAEQEVAPPTIHLQDKKSASSQSVPLPARKEKDEPARMAEQAPAVLPVTPPAAPAAAGGGSKGRMEPVPQPPGQNGEKPQEARQKAASVPLPVERKTAKGVAGDAALPLAESAAAPAVAPPPEDAGGWLAELRSACLSGRQEAQFWNEMTARGERLQARQVGGPTGRAEGKLVNVLALVQGMSEPETVKRQCRLILAELAKEGGSW
jgi:hypothetical protein